MYSIVIPYLSTSKYIDRCKHFLEINKSLPYELVEIVDETDVYYAFNYGVYKAKYDKVILLNDDMIVSKGWDYPLLKHNNMETITTGYVIEPNPGVNHRPDGETISNIKLDCGQSIDVFDYDKFQQFVDSSQEPDIVQNSKGWYMPICFDKKSFVSYPNRVKFPYEQNDVLLIDYVLPNLGYKFAKVKSFVYHFQSKSLKEN
jgi:hypothetical protein